MQKTHYNDLLISRKEELIDLQQESILAAQNERKKAIRDLVEDGIQKRTFSIKELIDKYNDALDSQKTCMTSKRKLQSRQKYRFS